ncbi:MAG: hypothetical protein F4246_08100 [Rhodothermaceae bacterium]|nr:hypothetical protein [Rhodothermaceae bacterium]MYD56960.1 hypothetical protein [Rhodothermaceae bacterium]MYJ54960.1 hypothetical protein [Rhodothermaceae bacterium]
MYRVSILALGIALFLGACSGPGSEGDRAPSSTLRFNLGTSARNHIVTTAARYGYRLDRRVDTAEDVRLETSWKEVNALEEEQLAGFSQVRVRVSVNARPRSRAGGTGSTFAARMVAECEGQLAVGGNWVEVPIMSGREAYFEEIAEYLENEFKGGVM